MSLEATEKECAANAVAPRVSLKDIEDAIAVRVHRVGTDLLPAEMPACWQTDLAIQQLRLMSICVLVMRNGFTVMGKSAPASAENFNRALGEKLAYEDAIRQLWPLMGFSLRDRLSQAGKA